MASTAEHGPADRMELANHRGGALSNDRVSPSFGYREHNPNTASPFCRSSTTVFVHLFPSIISLGFLSGNCRSLLFSPSFGIPVQVIHLPWHLYRRAWPILQHCLSRTPRPPKPHLVSSSSPIISASTAPTSAKLPGPPHPASSLERNVLSSVDFVAPWGGE